MKPLLLENTLPGLGLFVFGVYFIAHLPAIILLILGLVLSKRKPKQSRIFLIIAVVYFIIGGGICASMFGWLFYYPWSSLLRPFHHLIVAPFIDPGFVAGEQGVRRLGKYFSIAALTFEPSDAWLRKSHQYLRNISINFNHHSLHKPYSWFIHWENNFNTHVIE